MDLLTLGFGVSGIAGAVLAGAFGAVPAMREWYYERTNQPLKVNACPVKTQVNAGSGGRIQFRVYNRVRSEVPVQIRPMKEARIGVDVNGKPWVGGQLFEPRVYLYPLGGEAGFVSVPGHDSRSFVIELRVKSGVREGTERVTPVVVAIRFVPQEIPLGPYHFEVSPRFH